MMRNGPGLWSALHVAGKDLISSNSQKIFFECWIFQVEGDIGCETCFKKLQWFLKMWPVDYGEGFYLWGICLHDFVNKELGRPFFYPNLTLEPLRGRGIIQ